MTDYEYLKLKNLELEKKNKSLSKRNTSEMFKKKINGLLEKVSKLEKENLALKDRDVNHELQNELLGQ